MYVVYGLEGPQFEGVRDFLFSKTIQTGSGAHPASKF